MNLKEQKSIDLDIIRQNPIRFSWGLIECFHDIGPYTIVEFVPYTNRNAVKFSVYVDGKPTDIHSNTLEGAMLLAIAAKHCITEKEKLAHEARILAYAAAKILNVSSD